MTFHILSFDGFSTNTESSLLICYVKSSFLCRFCFIVKVLSYTKHLPSTIFSHHHRNASSFMLSNNFACHCAVPPQTRLIIIYYTRLFRFSSFLLFWYRWWEKWMGIIPFSFRPLYYIMVHGEWIHEVHTLQQTPQILFRETGITTWEFEWVYVWLCFNNSLVGMEYRGTHTQTQRKDTSYNVVNL